MSPSRQSEPLSNQFNISANVTEEKRVSQYKLTPEEWQERSHLRKTCDENKAREKQDFNNPEEFNRRFQDKYKELVDKHGRYNNDWKPPGGPGPVPRHQLMQMADTGVRLDHTSRLKGFDTEYQKGLNSILDRAAQDGRGPQPDHDPGRDQDNQRGHNRDRDRD